MAARGRCSYDAPMEPGVRRAAPGRLPERVYWFRRAFVLIGLALVIALLVSLVSLGGGPPPRSETSHTSRAMTSARPIRTKARRNQYTRSGSRPGAALRTPGSIGAS